MLSNSFSGRVLTALLCGSALAGSALAGEVSFTQSIPLTTTNWNNAVVLPKFDPDLGILESVLITLDAHIEGDIRFEELGNAPQTVTTQLSVKIEVFRRDMTSILSVEPSVTHVDTVTAHDGTT
jgi:hypothetical protein